MTKSLLVLAAASLVCSSSFAASHACTKAASAAANAALAKRVSDDCFQQFANTAKANANVINVGFSCDHTGKYLYQVLTAEQTDGSCVVVKVSKPKISDL